MSQDDTTQGGSLDLLLDTICNTFGGVLFISMLVVVLLNLTGHQVAIEPPSEAAQADLVEWRQRLTESNEEMKRLQTAFEDQEQIEDLVLEPGLKQLVEQLEVSEETRQNLLQGKNAELEEIGKSQTDINTAAQELKDLDVAMARARDKLDLIEQELAREIEKRTRAAKLPTPRVTTKAEVPFFLMKGRLTAYAKRDPEGNLVPNSAEYEERKDAAGKTYVQPKAGAGTAVDPAGRNRAALAGKLGAFDPNKHYLAIFVWPDSFEHFGVVRDLMVDKRFEYRLVPFPENGKIYIGAAEGDVIVF